MHGHVTKLVYHREAAVIIEAANGNHTNVLQSALLTVQLWTTAYSVHDDRSGYDRDDDELHENILK